MKNTTRLPDGSAPKFKVVLSEMERNFLEKVFDQFELVNDTDDEITGMKSIVFVETSTYILLKF